MNQALIIDDNSKNVTILAHLLSREGFSSIQMTNANNLDAILEEHMNIQVIFLDLEMPNLDGYQVLAKIKANANFVHVPVIAYTVHVSEVQVTLNRGFDGFIGKPLDSDRFPDQLARILNGDSVWEIP